MVLRIKEIMNFYKLNISDTAEKLGISQPNLSAILSGKRAIGDNTINRFVMSFGINRVWFTTGKGEMLNDTITPTNCNTEVVKQFLEKRLKSSKRASITIPLDQGTRPRIPYTAAAGSLTNAVEGITADQCEQVPRIEIFPDYDFTIIIKGDSMEPKYEGGDEVACKRIDSTSFIQWGKVHVLDTAQGILIKRTYEDGEKIRCVSYNAEYPDFSIDKSDIYSMSLVVGLVRL